MPTHDAGDEGVAETAGEALKRRRYMEWERRDGGWRKVINKSQIWEHVWATFSPRDVDFQSQSGSRQYSVYSESVIFFSSVI